MMTLKWVQSVACGPAVLVGQVLFQVPSGPEHLTANLAWEAQLLMFLLMVCHHRRFILELFVAVRLGTLKLGNPQVLSWKTAFELSYEYHKYRIGCLLT